MSSLRGFNSDKKLTDIINRINAIKAILESPVLPSGSATEAKQDDMISELAGINFSNGNIDNKITTGSDFTLSQAQQVLTYGEVTSGAGAGELHQIGRAHV